MKTHLEIGQIYREHGLKGLCKVYIYSLSDDNFVEGQTYLLQSVDGKTQTAVLQTLATSQKFFVVKFDCFAGADAVLPWRKAKIFLDRKHLARTEDAFYDADWLGFTVVDQVQETVGVITAVVRNPLLQLIVKQNEKEILIPWVANWVLKKDDAQKIVQLNLPQGLMDL